MAAVTLTKQNFEREVMQSDKPVLIDFWAPWCGPCRMLAPVIDELARETDYIKVGKVNVDEEPDLAAAFQIVTIPTLVTVKKGRVVNTSVGVRPKKAILSMVNA